MEQATIAEALYDFHLETTNVLSDAWAVHKLANRQESHNLVFASLIGSADNLRTINRALKTGNQHPMAYASLLPRNGDQQHIPIWRAWHTPLHNPIVYTSALHGISVRHSIFTPRIDCLAKEGQPTQWYLLVRNPAHAASRFLEQLTQNTEIIALPEWADQIWEIATAKRWVVPLIGYNIQGWYCEPDISELADSISHLLLQQRLPVSVN